MLDALGSGVGEGEMSSHHRQLEEEGTRTEGE